ncbi:T9SS type A sorting domain-containing protein, partial [candidate division KSB1 bacterium]
IGWRGIDAKESPVSVIPHADVLITALFETVSGVAQKTESDRIVMRNAYPNPCNAETTIEFYIGKEQDVQLSVFDVRGRRVKTIIAGRIAAGQHSFSWDGLNDGDKAVASGVYFLRLRAGEECRQQKIVRVD